MAIHIDEKEKVFHLEMAHSSYIFRVLNNAELQHLYYGRKIQAKVNLANLANYTPRNFELFTAAAPDNGLDEFNQYQPALIANEYASYGRGDFRHPAYQVKLPNGSRITQLKYQGYEYKRGKTRIDNLPSTFDDEGDKAEQLTIILKEQQLNLIIKLNYTIFPDQDVLVKNVQFSNCSNEKIELLQAMSLQLDLPDNNFDLIQFAGAWLRERYPYRQHLHMGIQMVDSLRYASSPQQNPFFMLARPATIESHGDVYAFNLIYSGNFQNMIEVDHYATTRVTVGINPFESAFVLAPNESFVTPEALLSFSSQGLNAMSQQLAAFYQKHLVNPNFSYKQRPIVLNSWEAMTYELSTEKILTLAKEAKEVGIELFVLDDGWFGHRNDDTSALGDWFTNEERIPEGISYLAKEIHKLGLQFGLWFEPEMISLDSELYRKHSEWLIKTPKMEPAVGRNQYVLDFTRAEVVEYLFNVMCKVIDETQLDYIKWDMNRHIADAYSSDLEPERQLEFGHRYILGVYKLFEKLTSKYKQVLFESCSSGGGRFDLGMMYYAPQAWTSDDTDPIERLKIQQGTSYGYSLSMMGTHVSASPNQQSGRRTSLQTRANVAYFGDFGYELDLLKLSETEIAEIRQQIDFYKKYRAIFQQGAFYRLNEKTDGNEFVWQVLAPDKTLAIVLYAQVLANVNPSNKRIYLQGLDAKKQYQVTGYDGKFYGDELMYAGLAIKLSDEMANPIVSTKDFLTQLLVVQEI